MFFLVKNLKNLLNRSTFKDNSLTISLIPIIVFVSAIQGLDFNNSVINFLILYIVLLFFITLKIKIKTVKKILKIFSILFLIIVFTLIIIDFTSLANRLTEIRGPNGMAFLIIGILPGIALQKKIRIKQILYLIVLFLLINVGSRSGLISFSLFLLYVYIKNKKAAIKYSLIIIILSFSFNLKDLILDQFKLNDDYRGLDSGFTGRTAAWLHAISEWFKVPFFGVGFNNTTIVFKDFSSFAGDNTFYEFGLTGTHNGYLSLLLETGVFGFLSFFSVYLSKIKQIRNNLLTNTSTIFTGFFISILFYSMFEDVLISFGNSTSLILLFILFTKTNENNICTTKHTDLQSTLL